MSNNKCIYYYTSKIKIHNHPQPKVRPSSPSHVSTARTELYSETQKKGTTTDNNSIIAENSPPPEEEEMQIIFQKFCDKNGLMNYHTLKSTPFLTQLLQDKELMEDELLAMWEEAPKASSSGELIDYRSFQKINREVNELFEDVVEENEEGEDATVAAAAALDEKELKVVFAHLANDDNRSVSKHSLRQWEEVKQLIDDGLLGEDEFDSLWERTSSSSEQMDLEGFLTFNKELDALFIVDDDEDDIGISSLERIIGSNLFTGPPATAEKRSDLYYDLSPEELFSRLADEDFLVGVEDLKRWGELQDVIASGDLLPLEVLKMFGNIPKAPGAPDRIDKEGFLNLYTAIDELFEDVDDEGSVDQEALETFSESKPNDDTEAKKSTDQLKGSLLQLLMELSDEENSQGLPCGLTADETQVRRVAEAVAELEKESHSNQVSSRGTELTPEDLAGDWELLYTSSAMMKFNKGLSGLGSSFPNGKFNGLTQKLKASKYLSDVEYLERIKTSDASFDVTITGDWKLKRSVSLLTGDPTIQLTVEPDRVNYGPTSTRADHWKSVRSMNLLDVTYLDHDFRIMRGNTSTDTIFIFRRI